MFAPSDDSSLAIYPLVKGSTFLLSNFFVTYPNVGLLEIFLFYKSV